MNDQAKVVVLRDDPTSTSGMVLAPAFALTPMAMLSQAVAQGASMDLLEKLMALAERWEKNQARKAFDAAIAEAKAEIPPIIKNRSVSYDSRGANAKTSYRHEDLGEIARTVDPILAKHGLSYRFRTMSEGNAMTVTCILSHRDGHCEENSLIAPPDATGGKNHIQAIGSTQTYLQRYTLKGALGLAATEDDDGKAATAVAEYLSEEQVETVQRLIVEVGADIKKFVAYMKAPDIALIPASQFNRAVDALNARRAKS